MLASVVGLFIVWFGGMIVGEDRKEYIGYIFSFAGAVLVVAIFLAAPRDWPSGLPQTSIDNGTYKVAFVYVAGENVNVGVEKKDGESERLYLYQFPMLAFDGNAFKTDGKELSVVESDGFRKLVLK